MEADYHYTECGLTNVILRGVKTVIDDAEEETYCIPNVKALHRAIAVGIITAERAMSGEELRFLRTEMELTQEQLADILKVSRATVNRWEGSHARVDQHTEVLLRLIVADRLGIDLSKSPEELASCVWTVESRPIVIDGSDPEDYRPLAA